MQVSLPFNVRPAFPRLLRPNDTAEIAALVQNQTGRDGRLVVEAVIGAGAKSPALTLLGPARVEVPLASGAETRVPFLVRALAAGAPKVELRARLESAQPKSAPIASDTIRLPIPVEPEPTLVDRVAMFGSLVSNQATAVQTRFPKAVQPGVGGISVSASASLLGELPMFSRTLLLMALHRTASDDPRMRTMVEELLGSISELPATAHIREVNWWGPGTGFPFGNPQRRHGPARPAAGAPRTRCGQQTGARPA